MLPSISCWQDTMFAFLATLLLDKWAYLLFILSKEKSLAGNLMQGSAYIHTVSGFQSVISTHCLKSNFLFITIKGFSIYFCTIHCSMSMVLLCLFDTKSQISTRFLYSTMPRPLELPAGLTIQMLRSPSILNQGWSLSSFFNTLTASTYSGWFFPISLSMTSYSRYSSLSSSSSSLLSSMPYSSSYSSPTAPSCFCFDYRFLPPPNPYGTSDGSQHTFLFFFFFLAAALALISFFFNQTSCFFFQSSSWLSSSAPRTSHSSSVTS